MENSMLVRVLKTFGAKEMRLFSEFIRSPYYNKNENIISLVGILEKNHPTFPSKKLEKEIVFHLLFGKKKFDDVKMRGILSDTLELAEEFLALENMKKQGVSTDAFLLNELNTRSLDALFEIRSKKMTERKKDVVQDKWFFLNRFLISAENTNQMWKLNDNKKEKLVGSNLYETTLDHLTEFYAYEGLRMLTQMTILQYAMQYSESDLTYRDKLLNFFETIKNPSEIFSYLKLFQKVATKNDDAAFQDLKQLLLNQTSEKLSRQDTLTGFDLLTIYCYSHNARGIRDYVKDTFDILKRFEELGLHVENGFMEDAHFVNMIIMALKNEECDWARKYIVRSEQFLKKETRDDIINYCLGSVAEKEKKYKEALGCLSKVKNPSLLLGMNIKAMLIKMYYEKGDMNQVLKTCVSFNKFLNGNSKLSLFQKKIWCSFVDNSILLAKVNSGKLEMDIDKWAEEIETTGEMIVKGWVLKKVKDLKK
jgi:hypothetical protein